MTSERWLKSLALASVLLFAGLTGYTLNALLDLQDELSADLGENMVWAASQAEHLRRWEAPIKASGFKAE